MTEKPGGGGVLIRTTKTLKIFNQSLDEKEFRPGWQFGEADHASGCRITYLIDDEETKVAAPGFSEAENGYSAAFGEPVKISPQYKNKSFSFRAECTFEQPDNWYHPWYFQHPTIGVTVSVEAPDGWLVWVGRAVPKTNLTNRAEFHDRHLYMTDKRSRFIGANRSSQEILEGSSDDQQSPPPLQA